jgi:hypothetical protein
MNESKTYNVKINQDEVLRYLGCADNENINIEADIINQLNTGIERIEKISEPKYTFKVFSLERSDGRIFLKGTSFEFRGNDAAKLLYDCDSCIIFAATLGRAADMLIHRTQITDMSEAVILDSCASSAIESICDQLNDDLIKEYESKGLFLTDRYSPGYGDMPLDMQSKLCELLNTSKRIGLSVSPGMTLTPSKSVTAIIGISDKPQQKRQASCDECRLKETCNLRKAGQTCGRR